MTSEKRTNRNTVTAAFAALLVGLAATATGCGAKIAVQAVARGVPTVAPFFDEALGLGTDFPVGAALALDGGTKKGDQPGLYGGSRTRSCAKKKLVRFLKDPANRQKALAWASVQGIDVDETEAFVKKLTPVVLRNDTLVKNHDYRKGKAVRYDALLEAGIAVLVDRYGKPVVKCSCGNPLGAFTQDAGRADVTFKGKSKKWKAYHREKVVTIAPVVKDRPVVAYELVDLEKENAGLERRAGTDGRHDKPLPDDPGAGPAEARVAEVTGRSAQEATQILEEQGFRVRTTDGPPGGADPGTVLGQDPAADEQVSPGATVTLTVAPAADPDPTGTEPPPSEHPDPFATGDPDPGAVPDRTDEPVPEPS